MEFYVVDPKDITYPEWTAKVREFIAQEGFEHTVTPGGLYYLGDDVAAPWSEDSIKFTIESEEFPGVVEIRDVDENFYLLSDDLSLFDERDVELLTGLTPRASGVIYGFRWNSNQSCRFHQGPSQVYVLCSEDDEFPARQPLSEIWTQLFQMIHLVSNCTSRLQDLRGINLEKVLMDFEVDVSFPHAASLDALNELLVDEEGYERTKNGLRATFRDRTPAWIRDLVSLLPPDDEDFDRAHFRAVWRGDCSNSGAERELFYVGIEKRKLRPFVHLPVHRTSKKLMERFRAFFKGHRIDRQEYSL